MIGAINLARPSAAELLRGMAGPTLIVMLLAMMVLPLPPFVLDMLFTFNIAFSIMVLLVGVSTVKPLDFAVFPTVLLVTTLLRLSLNIASTRVVLLEGHTGPAAAGKVIESFGHFLVGDNYAVGLVVFVIMVVINFVVITKGAGRIAEVGARFTLDAMPGKQMAIDADLNAGLIGEEDARKRRAAIAQEADFFGSMDGASKFVRGDAVAGIIILFINIFGGLVVGVVQHDMDIASAAKVYTLLTIGDGLVAQIPALLVSTAAGLVVSRVSTDQDTGQQLLSQLLARPQALALTGGIVGIMGMVPGMPHIAFLLLAAAFGGIAYAVHQRRSAQTQSESAPGPVPAPETHDVSWSDVTPVDTLGLEVGYRLIPLVDKGQDGELLKRIKAIRRKFAQEIGFLPPAIHIRDNLELRPNGYRITLKGVEIGQHESHAGMLLAINPGRVTAQLPGAATVDPAFGLPAVWVDAGLRDAAHQAGYTVVDAGTVVATHLSQLIHTHAADLLGRQELQQLLDHLSRDTPKLVEDVVPKLLPMATLQQVLQNLLEEGVHIRDMRTIIEVVAAHAGRTQDAGELTALVRVALGRAVVQQIFPGKSELQVIALDPALERLLLQTLQAGAAGSPVIEPELADTLLRGAQSAARQQEQFGFPAVLLVPPALRVLLSRFLRRAIPLLKVLAHSEVPDARSIKVTSVVGSK
ncbi:MAG: flagellar biosynthesis protein FlhA [Betaproteobacteria bacterium]|nr:flagellar biosynthesis protein FlhA [Betaproteobacteria bacterium]